MSDSILDIEWDGPLPPCIDCKKPLDGKAVEHGLEGFGHQGRCCDCYDKRMRGETQTKRGR